MNCSHRAPPDPPLDTEALEDLLSEPTEAAVNALAGLRGDLLILGAGGKIGPTLSRMARRASDAANVSRRVIAVSRFSDANARDSLQAAGVETHSADLFNPQDVAGLPEADLIIYLVGRKFGTSHGKSLTWATNVALPTIVCQRLAARRIVALSTLCVYPFVSPGSGGSKENDAPSPIGEYAMSALGRERVFEHFSRTNNSPTALLRLTYSVEMRYGVLVDIAMRVWREEPIDLSMGFVNVLWQADANAGILVALELASQPAKTLNIAGPEFLSVRDLAEQFGERLGKRPRFVRTVAPDAWLPSTSASPALSAAPRVGVEQLIEWTARWIREGRELHHKATRFEVRDGEF